MSSIWDDDPLAGLPEITPHPSRFGSEALSPPPASPIIQQHELDLVNDVLSEYQPIHASDDTAKVLRAFVDHLPGPGRLKLQSDIYCLKSDPYKRNFLVDSILKPMAVAGGKQPPVTPSPNESAAFAIELAMTQIEGSTRAGQKSLKKECLCRDWNRCVVSGLIDSETYHKIPPGERKGTRHTSTECAHILPFALSKLEEKNATHTKNKATTWWALYEYFPALKNKIVLDTVN